ncbi:hypothetical protein IRJ41_000406 [Triplophysa rosa]|uniref:Uncharacterized protein n=1 Tax=Triplophysa rosa TaxID=992332 RepID=A0A9W8C6I3_TRIRA|nr:hypothetical protein IRJ41_000406 [Triplophysa rosa]
MGLRDLLLFGLIVVTASCLRIGHAASSGMGFSHGTIANRTLNFGRLIIGSGVSNDSADSQGEQPNGYWSGEQAQFQFAEAKLKRLGPSVHCGNDAMTLRVPGPRMPHFLVDRGVGSPVPLSEIPASCGISVKRVRRDVTFSVPFHGCPVRQQRGSYILSLILMGAPVQASCPESSPLPTVSCLPTGMVILLGLGADKVKIKVDGSWQPLLLEYSKCGITLDTVDGTLVVTAPFTGSCWVMKDTERHLPLLYLDQEVILSCPLTLPTAATTVPSADPQVPLTFPWWYYPSLPGPGPGWPGPSTADPTLPSVDPQGTLVAQIQAGQVQASQVYGVQATQVQGKQLGFLEGQKVRWGQLLAVQAYVVQAYVVQAYVVQAYVVQAYVVQAYVVQAYVVQAYVVQAYVVQAYVVQAYVVQAYVVQAYVVQAYVVQAYVVQAYVVQAYVVQAYVVQAYVVQAYVVQAYVVQAYVVQAYVVQAYVVQAYVVQAYVVQAYVVQAYVVQAYVVQAYVVQAYVVQAYVVQAYVLVHIGLVLVHIGLVLVHIGLVLVHIGLVLVHIGLEKNKFLNRCSIDAGMSCFVSFRFLNKPNKA